MRWRRPEHILPREVSVGDYNLAHHPCVYLDCLLLSLSCLGKGAAPHLTIESSSLHQRTRNLNESPQATLDHLPERRYALLVCSQQLLERVIGIRQRCVGFQTGICLDERLGWCSVVAPDMTVSCRHRRRLTMHSGEALTSIAGLAGCHGCHEGGSLRRTCLPLLSCIHAPANMIQEPESSYNNRLPSNQLHCHGKP